VCILFDKISFIDLYFKGWNQRIISAIHATIRDKWTGLVYNIKY
jgi:hypothetical protein